MIRRTPQAIAVWLSLCAAPLLLDLRVLLPGLRALPASVAGEADRIAALEKKAFLLMGRQEYAGAQECLQRALALRKNDLQKMPSAKPEEDVYCLGLTGVLAAVKSRLGRTAEAEALFHTWYSHACRGSDEEKLTAFQGQIGLLRKLNRSAEAEVVAARARSVMGEKAGAAFGSGADVWQSAICEGDAALKMENLTKSEQKYLSALKLANSSADGGPRQEASLFKLGGLYLDWQRIEDAERVLSQALSVDRQRGKQDRQLQCVLVSLAQAKFAAGKTDESIKLFEQAFSIMESNKGTGALETAVLFRELCDLRSNDRKQWQKIEYLYRLALARTEKALGRDDAIVAICAENLGMVLWRERKKSDAVALFKRAMAIYRKEAGCDDVNVAHALLSLGDVYLYSANYPEAESAFKRAAQIVGERCGSNSRELARYLARLIEVYKSEREYARAEPLARRCLDIWVVWEGDGGSNVIIALETQAQLYEAQKKWAQAVEPRQRLLSIWEKEPQYWSSHAGSLDKLADDYANAGQQDSAEPLYLQAFVLWEKRIKPDGIDLLPHIDKVAGFYLAARKYRQARQWYQKSVTLCESLYANRDSQAVAGGLTKPLINLASACQGAGQYNDAEQLLRRALELNERASGVDGSYRFTEILQSYAGLLTKMGRSAEAARMSARAAQCRRRWRNPPAD